jgi:hypothetical protein
MATSFSGGEPPTMGKQLVNFITCTVSRVHPFCNVQSRVRTHDVLVIGLYELLGNPAESGAKTPNKYVPLLSLSVTYDRPVVFSGYSRFLHQ